MPENKWTATSEQKMPCHKMQQGAWKTKLKPEQGISHPRALNEILMAQILPTPMQDKRKTEKYKNNQETDLAI